MPENLFVPWDGGEEGTDPLRTFNSIQARSPDPTAPEPANLFDRVLAQRTLLFPEMDTNVLMKLKPGSVEDPPRPAAAAAYRLHRMIGRGGNGEIWEATQTSLDRVIAVKRLRDRGVDYDGEEMAPKERAQAQSFRQEAMTTGALEHPNVVPVYDFGLDQSGRPLLAMKLIKGNPWDGLIRRDLETMPADEFLAKHLPILIGMAQAVAFAHSRGIVHRDLKPAQVMLGEFGEVILTDWGLALVYDEGAVPVPDTPRAPGESRPIIAPTTATASNPAGTPAFMAPEQTEASATNIGPWTDVYLLGATLYLLLTGTPVHDGKTISEVLDQARSGDVEAPSVRSPRREIPADLAELVMGCLARDWKARPASAKDFILGLQDHLSGAGRRRESRALIDETTARFRGAGANYRELADCLNTLGRATALWPANPEAAPLRMRVLVEYAEAALRHRDLRLARVQADAMDTGPEKSRLEQRIDEEARRVARHAWQRRILIGATIALLATVSLVGIQERRQANKARREQGFAENLMNYMLTDLKDRLRPINRLDLLDSVAKKAMDYFEARGNEDDNDTTMRQRAQALENVAQIFSTQGKQGAGLESLRPALAIREKVLEQNPGDDSAALQLALTCRLIAYNEEFLGKHEAARHAAQRACDLAEGVLARKPSDPEALKVGVRSQFIRATILRLQGDMDGSIDAFRRAIREGERLVALDAGKDSLSDLASAHLQCAVTLQAAGQIPEALGECAAGARIREKQVAQEPDDAVLLQELILTYLAQGGLQQASADYAGASATIRRGMEIADDLARKDPSNAYWSRTCANLRQCLGEALLDQGDVRGAAKVLDESEQLLRSLLKASPSNNEYHFFLGLTEFSKGRQLAEDGDQARARERWQEAAEALQGITANGTGGDPAARDYLARALLALGRPEQATSIARELSKGGYKEAGFLAYFATRGIDLQPGETKPGS